MKKAGNAHRLAVDDAGQGDDRNVGRAAADVDHHVARRLGDGHSRADCRRHGFFNQVNFAGLGSHRAVFHRAALDLRYLRRHPNHNARAEPPAAPVRFADEVRQHFFGGLEVGDDAVFHRLDGHDVTRRPPEHFLGIGAHGFDAAIGFVNRDDRRLADDDPFAAREHAGVGRPEVDGEIVGEAGEQGQSELLTNRKVFDSIRGTSPEARLMPRGPCRNS